MSKLDVGCNVLWVAVLEHFNIILVGEMLQVQEEANESSDFYTFLKKWFDFALGEWAIDIHLKEL